MNFQPVGLIKLPQGGLIDINDGDGPVAFFIAGAGESWRKSD